MVGRDFFKPRSIAVIGASAKPNKIGFSLVKNLLDGRFVGKIYPINLNEENILGLKCHASVRDIPTSIDLAIIVVPAVSVGDVLRDCGHKKIKYAIIISAGFAEVGRTGSLLQDEVSKTADKFGIRILGPNCLGVISPINRLNASFSLNMPEKKNVGVISQSGATCTAILDWANKKGIGFSHFVSMGNKIDLNENDFLSNFINDAQTEVVLSYLESISDGPAFLKIAKKLSREKPFILLKSGVSKKGQEAAKSHTAALAADNIVMSEAFYESGIIRAESLGEMFELSMVFSELKLTKSNKILVVTNAGGPAVMATDAIAEQSDLDFFVFSGEQKETLKKRLPSRVSVSNPLDLQGDATSEDVLAVIQSLRAGKNNQPDLKLIMITPQANTDIENIARVISEEKDNKTVVVLLGGKSFDEANRVLAEAEIPTFSYPESAVSALASLAKYSAFRRKKENVENFTLGIKKAAEKVINNRHELSDSDLAKLLASYRIPMADSKLTHNSKEAIEAANKIGYPVVLKVTSPDILHKTEVGAIKLGIANDQELEAVYDKVLLNAKKHYPEANILGVTVYKMVHTTVEVAIGAKRDPVFGPFVMFGLGGIYIEIFKDFEIRLAPTSIEEATQMIKSIKSYALLNGYRNGEKFDIEPLARAVSGLSKMMIDFPEISEVDINPIHLSENKDGILALDAKVIFNQANNG